MILALNLPSVVWHAGCCVSWIRVQSREGRPGNIAFYICTRPKIWQRCNLYTVISNYSLSFV